VKTVAGIISEYVNKSGRGISALAKKAQVNRLFLNRLHLGQKPPRVRAGRIRAEHDQRYRRIARAMEIDEEQFCTLVSSEQVDYVRVVEVPVLPVQNAVDRLGTYALRGEGAPEERDSIRSQLQRIIKALEPT
jgi:hypothetical protein